MRCFCLQVEQYMKPYDLTNHVYQQVGARLLYEMERGLSKQYNSEAVIKMYPTYVRALPNGTGI